MNISTVKLEKLRDQLASKGMKPLDLDVQVVLDVVVDLLETRKMPGEIQEHLLNMRVHEKLTDFPVDYGRVTVTRVLGGWIYELSNEIMENDGAGVMKNWTDINAVFVPEPLFAPVVNIIKELQMSSG